MTIEPFGWSGLFPPFADSMPVNSGRALPLKFSLGGYRGLDIFANGSPASRQVSCNGATAGEYLPTDTAGASSLSYDASSSRYTYTWKTQKNWAGSCRELLLEFVDGSRHTFTLTFTK